VGALGPGPLGPPLNPALAVTVPATSASCKRSFSTMKLVKAFLIKSMKSKRLSNIFVLSVERVIAENYFVDEFDSRQIHVNRMIEIRSVDVDIRL